MPEYTKVFLEEVTAELEMPTAMPSDLGVENIPGRAKQEQPTVITGLGLVAEKPAEAGGGPRMKMDRGLSHGPDSQGFTPTGIM